MLKILGFGLSVYLQALNGWFFLLPNQTVGGGNCVASPISSTAFDLSENHVADERFDLKHKATKTVASANVQVRFRDYRIFKLSNYVYDNQDIAMFTSDQNYHIHIKPVVPNLF